jgi:ABC-type transporter Mla subunit MlaD
MKKLEETVSNLKTITDKTDTLLGDNKKKVDETLANVTQITQNLKELTEDLKKSPWKLIRKP